MNIKEEKEHAALHDAADHRKMAKLRAENAALRERAESAEAELTVTLPAATVERVREALGYALETFRVMKSDDNPTAARLRAALALLPPPAKETP